MAHSGLWRLTVDSTGVSDASSGSERNLRVRKKNSPPDEVELITRHSRILRDGSRVLICPHCPFATKSAKRFVHHFKHHRIEPKDAVQPRPNLATSGSAKRRNGERQSVTCPFCSYQTFSHVSSFKHAQMHFNFKHFLAIRGLEVRYERHWSKCDTVEMHIRAQQEDGTSNGEDNVENADQS